MQTARANCSESACHDGYEYTAPVGSFPAGVSPEGCFDMAGNVWEWVWDRYDSDYYAGSPAENPLGPAGGSYRVLRGGDWSYDASSMRAANRNYYSPDYANGNLGFRCAR